MNYTKKLEKILDTYAKKCKETEQEYELKKTKKALYEELITYLNTNNQKIEENKGFILIFLDSIYGDSLYSEEFKKMLSAKIVDRQGIEELLQIIITDYKELKEELEYLELQIEEESELKSSATSVKTSLKYHKLIDNPITNIKNIITILTALKSKGIISEQEYLLLVNELEYHNERKLVAKGHPDDKFAIEDAYNEVPNIVTIGFQEYEPIEVSHNKQSKLDKYIKEILEQIKDKTKDEIITLLKSYNNNELAENEYNYIIQGLLSSYLDELLTLYKLLFDKDVYSDKESRREVIKNYYDTLSKYSIIGKYYNDITEYTITEEETTNIDYTNTKKLIYSHSNTNVNKARLISDMSSIPNEYYDTVYDLLTRFKNGTIGKKEFKALSNSYRKFGGYLELRYDQVRIILKHIKDNIYNVLGVFAKKSDNDITMYGRIINRMIPDVDTDSKLSTQLEIATHTEEELAKLVKEKGRKGTR